MRELHDDVFGRFRQRPPRRGILMLAAFLTSVLYKHKTPDQRKALGKTLLEKLDGI